MSTTTRRKFKLDFKAKVAIECIGEQKTIEEICKKYEIHPTQANLCRKEFLTDAAFVFDKENKVSTQDDTDKKVQELYAQIGQSMVENDFLKKKSK